MRKNRTSNIALKAFGVTAAAGLALTGIAGTANAAPGTVNGGADTSLTITKCVAPNSNAELPAGTGKTDVTCPAGTVELNGVEFTIQQVTGIDLTTNAGWIAADNLSAAMKDDLGKMKMPFVFDLPETISDGSATPVAIGLGTAKTGTVAGAPVVFDAVATDVGMYLVYESKVPNGVTAGAPFLVTLPMTDAANEENWIYHINVYPKNSVDGITKSVSDADDNSFGSKDGAAGADKGNGGIVYTLKGDIPDVDVIDGYMITDILDSRLDFVKETVKVGATTLEKGTHYTVNESYKHKDDAAGDPARLAITFIEDGLRELEKDTTLQVEVTLDVNVVGPLTGEIENQAWLFPNAGAILTDEGVFSEEVITKWGSYEAVKMGDDGKLAGAQFAIYSNEDEARAGVEAGRISVNGKTVWTTGADGILRIDGLRYSDFANNKDIVLVGDETDKNGDEKIDIKDAAGYQDYWLAEIKAPDGYQLLAAPINFQITGTGTEAAGVVVGGAENTIRNVKDVNLFPAVGGAGAMALYIAGGAVVAGAVVLTIRNRRVES